MIDSNTRTTNGAPSPMQESAYASGLAKFASGNGGYGEGAVSKFDIGEYIRTVLKWKKFIAAAVVLCVLAALVYSYTRQPLYSSTSQLIIQDTTPQVSPDGGKQSAVMSNAAQYLATQMGLVKSQSQAKRVVRRLRLAEDPSYADQSLNAEARAEQAASKLRSQVQVENVRDSRLINISVISPSAIMAAKISNAYAEEFIAANLERGFEATAFARDFLEKQLEATRQKLEASERQLVEFASSERIIELGRDKEGNASQSLDATSLIKLNEALSDARVERITAAQDLRHSNSSSSNEAASTTIQSLRTEKARLEAEYRQKSATFLPEYPVMKSLREGIESLNRAIASDARGSRSDRRESLQAKYDAALSKERELIAKVDELKEGLLKLRSRSIEYSILQRDVDTNRVLYEGLLQRYKEVGVTDGVGKNEVAIVDKAMPRNVPISPNIPFNLLLGLLAGLALGIGGAFLIEFMGDSINLPEEVERKLNLTLLGVLPSAEKGVRLDEEANNPKSEIAEAAYSLRTALQFTTSHGAPKSLMLTSSRPAEGKSSVSYALSLAFARQGKKVLLVDADMRRPTFYPGLQSRDDEAGLSNVLTGQMNGELPIRATQIENLSLMTAGPMVPNPADLLSTNAYSQMIERALTQFDIVIADGPPVLGLADALLLGTQSEAVIMVVEASAIRRSQVLTALRRMRSTNAHIVGAVLNKFNRANAGYGYGYGYGYDYDYGQSSGQEPDHERRIILKS